MVDMERNEKELKEIDQELLKQRIVQDQKVNNFLSDYLFNLTAFVSIFSSFMPNS